MIAMAIIVVIGLVQLFYVIPWCKKLKQEKLYKKLQGVIAETIVTFLLNYACYRITLWLLIS